MGRPRTRTDLLDAEELGLYRECLGGSTNAYRQLIRRGEVSFPVFLRAWQGKLVSPEVAQAVRDGWDNWMLRMVQICRERQKEPV